jgi:hypothetical protein
MISMPREAGHAIDVGLIVPPSLVAKASARNVRSFYRNWLAELDRRGAMLARADRVNTPAYVRIVFDRELIYRELVADKRFRFSQERADKELKHNRDRDVVQAFAGIIARGAKDPVEAESIAREAFSNPQVRFSRRMRKLGIAETIRAMQLETQVSV